MHYHLDCNAEMPLAFKSGWASSKLRKHIGVLSWSEKVNFCLFSVLKRGTYLVKNSQKRAYVTYERPLTCKQKKISVIKTLDKGPFVKLRKYVFDYF